MTTLSKWHFEMLSRHGAIHSMDSKLFLQEGIVYEILNKESISEVPIYKKNERVLNPVQR